MLLYNINRKIVKTVIIPLADLLMHTSLKKFYNHIKDMHCWSKSEIAEWQNKKLTQLIEYAYRNTDYYKNLFDENNIVPSDIKKH